MALYLGLDSSTQGLKAILIDPAQQCVAGSASVNYGQDLPEYGCRDGVLPNDDPVVKHSDPLLWVAALDLLLKKMQAAGLPLGDVCGIGGSGQQHGSVYLNEAFFGIVDRLNPECSLAEQIAPALSRRTSPIWMDSSTSTECAEISAAVGERLQATTGSPAIERFTGPQIRKFRKTDPVAYRTTRRIHLVSSFLCSVLIGGDAPIDSGDGAGMNLLNLNTLQWDPEIAEATAPGLIDKLPRLVPTPGRAGGLSPYFAKYGLTAGIPVAIWTGDNPASLVGCGGIGAGSAVISLGTSDTFFAALDPYRVDPAGFGHVFGHPAGGFMCLTCFKNGSLARERVKDEAGIDWKAFDEAFEQTPVGNQSRWALPWFEAEITPRVTEPGLRANFDFEKEAPEVRIRAVVEAQALALRTHSLWMGEFTALRVTGGASQSSGILQVLANVFGAAVETLANPGSAGLGAALIAAHVGGGHSYGELTAAFCPPAGCVEPEPAAVQVYREILPAFGRFETEAQKPGFRKS